MTANLPAALPVMVESTSPVETADCIDLFVLEQPIGEGALAQVWRARDRRDGTVVALKRLHHKRRHEAWRIKHEYRALSRIWSPHVVAPRELVQPGDGSPAFFTMQCIDGEAPGRFLAPHRGGPALARVFLLLARQLVEAVRAVHAAGFVHRDIKPQNILVDPSGRLVLMDLDLAVHVDRGPHGAGRIAGSPSTSAPEVDQGLGSSFASDWFSAGATLWTLLCGHGPFRGTMRQILLRKRTGRADLSGAVLDDIPDPALAALRRMIAVDPRDRPSLPELELAFGLRPLPRSPRLGLDTLGPVLEAVNRAVRRSGPHILRLTGSVAELPELSTAACRGIGRDSGVLLLHGECARGERVPLRALDAVVEQLVGVLRTLPAERMLALLPRDLAPLLRVFPSFHSLGALRELGRPVRPLPGARGRALDGLREILLRLAQHRRVVLWLDRIDEADMESTLALDRLLQGAPLDLVLVLAAPDTPGSPAVAAVDRLLQTRLAGHAQVLHLPPRSPRPGLRRAG